jgi:hypothetical protein
VTENLSRTELFTGTKEVAEQHRFDVAALEAYLRTHVQGAHGGAIQGRAVESYVQADDTQ